LVSRYNFNIPLSHVKAKKLTIEIAELADKIKITLVEALPNVLPAFSKQLIDYTESTFKEQNITIHTRTMVKEVQDKSIVVQKPDGSNATIPYGLLVWATGNTVRPVIRNLMGKLSEHQKIRRGLDVDDWLQLKGADGIYALGDVSATKYAPTAQVASQQGSTLWPTCCTREARRGSQGSRECRRKGEEGSQASKSSSDQAFRILSPRFIGVSTAGKCAQMCKSRIDMTDTMY
jgi:NADH dehydrogenase FAD-containing subunit